MPIDVRCPGCSASFPVTESGRTSKVECPYCDRRFVLAHGTEGPEDERLAPGVYEGPHGH